MEADDTQICDADAAGISKSRHHHVLYHGSGYTGSSAARCRPDDDMPGRLRTRVLSSQQDKFDIRSSKGVEDDVFVTPKQSFHRCPTNAVAPTEVWGCGREAVITYKQLQKEIKDIVQAEIKAMMRSLTKKLFEQFGREAQKVLQDIMGEVMKEMDGMAMAMAEAVAMAIQSAQTTWANVVMVDTHCQAPGSGVGELCMVILARHNREALMHSDPNTLTSNSISSVTVEAINIMLTSNEAMAI